MPYNRRFHRGNEGAHRQSGNRDLDRNRDYDRESYEDDFLDYERDHQFHEYENYEQMMRARERNYQNEDYRLRGQYRNRPEEHRASFSSNQPDRSRYLPRGYQGGYNQGGYGEFGYDQRYGNAGGYGSTGSYSSGHNAESFENRGNMHLPETEGHEYYNTDRQRGKYYDQGNYQHEEKRYGGFDDPYEPDRYRSGHFAIRTGEIDERDFYRPDEGEVYSGGFEGMGRSEEGSKWKDRKRRG